MWNPFKKKQPEPKPCPVVDIYEGLDRKTYYMTRVIEQFFILDNADMNPSEQIYNFNQMWAMTSLYRMIDILKDISDADRRAKRPADIVMNALIRKYKTYKPPQWEEPEFIIRKDTE